MVNFIEKIKAQSGTKKIVFVFILIAVILFVGFILGNSSVSLNSTSSVGRMVESPYLSSDSFNGEAVSGGSYSNSKTIQSNTQASTPSIKALDRKIIQNGSLQVLVKKAEETVLAIQALSSKYEGFTESSYLNEVSDGIKAGSIVIRIPSKYFNQAMSDIKSLAVKVNRENTNTSDVTAQFVDFEAQLRNLNSTELQYIDIMKKAVRIEDVLNVQSRLSEVRGQIEQIQGQINYLSRQIEMSTINVSLTSEPEVRVFGIIWRPLTVLKQAIKSGLADLTGFVDWLIIVVFKLPVLLLKIALFGLVLMTLWKAILWFKNKFLKVNQQ